MAGEIFISYRRADLARARRLHDLLKAEGVEAWYDAQVGAGQDWRATTAAALQKASIFVLLFTKTASESEDIAKELAAATFSKKLVVPVRLENIQPEGAFLYELASRNWMDAFEDTDARLAELAKTLATLVKDGGGAQSVVQFERQAQPARKKHLLRRPVWIAGTGLAVLLLSGVVAAVTFLPLGGSTPPRQTIAFFGFAPADDAPETVSIAANTTREVRDTLAAMRLETVAESDTRGTQPDKRIERAKELHALYALSGEVRTEGDRTTVSILLEDIPSRATIWSESVFGSKTEAITLPVQAATLATDTLSCTARIRSSLKRDDPSVVAMLPDICRTIRLNPDDIIQRFRDFRDKAPDSGAQATFAMGALLNLRRAPLESRDALMQEIDAAMDRARQLNPKNPSYLLARFTRATIKEEPFTELERIALENLEIARADATLNAYYLNMLRSLGRFKDIPPYARAAVAGDPLSTGKPLDFAQNLAETGQPAEAARRFERTMQRTPTAGVWATWVRAAMVFGAGDPDALLAAPPSIVGPEIVACLRVVRASLAALPAAQRKEMVDKVQACLDQQALSPTSAYLAFAALGDKDRAFALARGLGLRRNRAEGAMLYWPATANLRLDAGFTKLAEDLGLLDYWRDSGHPPDFCATEKNAPVCDLIKAK